MDTISVVSASVPNTAAAAGMMPHSLAVFIWAPVALMVLGGIFWLALSAWLERRHERAMRAMPLARAVPRLIDLPLDLPAPEPRRVQTAPRQLPAPWLDLDLDFGPSQVTTRTHVRSI